MDLTNFLPPCQQRNELEIQAPRAPATPAKPVPTRPHLLSGNGQGELKSGSNWGVLGHVSTGHHHAALYGGHTCHNGSSASRHFLAQLQDLNTNGAPAALAPTSQVHSLNAGSLLPRPFNHSMGGWTHMPMPCCNLLAFTDTTATSKMAAPFVVTHIGNSQEAAVPPNQLLLNGKVLLSPATLSHDNNRQLPMSQHQHEFPIPFLPNLNSLPENTSTGAGDAMPCPSTPVSQDNKGKRPVGDLPREVIDLVEATVTDCIINVRETVISQTVVEQERDMCSSKPMAVLSEEVPSNSQTSQLQAVLPSEGSSVQLIDTEEQGKKESQGIDLNKEPLQKPKRRKHRPKVIREGKPNRTPKPKTPKPVTPKPANNIGPTGKRKYVRRKNLNSMDSPSSSVKDIVEPADGSRMKSVRRSLNFDSEGFQTRDKSLGSGYAFHIDSTESQGRGACVVGTAASSSTKSNTQLAHGVEVLLEDSTEAIAFDLNQSVSQITNSYTSFSQKPAKNHQPSRRKITGINPLRDGYAGMQGTSTPPPHPSRRKLIRENLNNLARKNGSRKIVGDLDGSPSDDLVTGSKRGHNLIDVASAPTHTKFMNAYNETNQVSECHDIRHHPCLTETCKKRRTEEQIEFTSNASSVSSSSMPCAPSKSSNAHHMVPSNSTAFTFTDASLLAHEKLRASEAMLSFVQIDKVTKNRFTESVPVHNPTSSGDTTICNQLSTPEKPYEHSDINCNKSAWGMPSGSDDRQEDDTNAVPARVETVIADSNEKVKPKPHRKKGQAQVASSTSSDANIICMQEYGALSINGSSVGHKSVQTTAKGARKPRKKNSDILHMRSIQDCQSSSSFPESLSQAVTSYGVLIEAIIQKLKHLNINKIHEDVIADVQNALVLYGGGVNTMVPYEGPLDLVKKRRPRVKVDLDPETHRKWKLLMENGNPDGDDVMDKDKEKWWEEERRVFHGRANSFIARMHLVQGDRRFSQWKGSVVDSVVGVFLTQNVSDHLSSSAFMALAARFRAQTQGTKKEANADDMVASVSQQDESILPLGDNIKLQEKIPGQQFSDGSSTLIHEAENITGKEMADSSSLQCGNAGSMVDYLKGRDINLTTRELEIVGESPNSASHESSDTGTDTPVTVTGSTSYAETEDRRSPDDVISSQNSVVSSQNSSEYPVQTACQVGSASEAGGETDLIIESMFNGMESSTSFTKLLEMADERILSRQYSSRINQLAYTEHEKTISDLHQLDYSKGAYPSVSMSNNFHHAQDNFMGQPCIPFTSYHLHNSLHYRLVETQSIDTVRERGSLNLPPSTSVLSKTNNIETTVKTHNSSAENTTEAAAPQKFPSSSRTVPVTDLYAFMSKQPVNQPTCSQTEICTEMNILHHDNISGVRTEASQGENMSHIHMQLPDRYTANLQQNERKTDSQVENTQHAVEVQAQMSGCRIHQTLSKSHSNLAQTTKVTELAENPKPEVHDSHKVTTETESNKQRGKKVRAETGKSTSDWDSLRRQACSNSTRKERNSDAMDSVDWEAVRQADVHEISNTIRERGMNNMLAERIKEFLNRLVKDHGSIDLEWLRDVPPDKAKDYLLSIRGLGIKSVECVRLLTLQHLAFPVDTNVGRICVRLGWVPLQPLPESLQLHLLELYPVLETIQKYLWPRLCTLDQRTLYELHYQMITFGKVFCTKSKPNCNACPMRGECKHFASAFASARLALPGPEEKRLVSSTIPTTSYSGNNVNPNPMPLAQLEGSTTSEKERAHDICEPIIEEPATPEPECIETSESAIEDAFFEDPDEIPTINLNFEAFTQNLQNYMQANNMEMQDGDMSRALVLLSPEATSIPMPKLKNVSRLRTEHQVYELPDSHPLLEGFDQREPDDPCSYLLAIWTPGETAQSTEPPTICCNSQETGKLCNRQTCFACSSKREAENKTVRGTLLIPCRTAMRGSFPLNGTYFQVNEVFADHDSSHNPVDVPREWIWDLPRRTVYFGTSIPTIFKGLSTEGIQHCFWRGFVCVRGFDRTTRAPKPLYARLHFPASKATRNKRTAANDE